MADNLYVRREFLKSVAKRSAVLAGLIATAHLPYKKPKVDSFFGVKSAYAQITPSTTIRVTGNLGILSPGTVEDTGQDAYEFDCPAGLTLQIDVTTDQYVWAEIGLFAPGTTTADTNLLTGGSGGLEASGQGAAINTSWGPTEAGTYTIAIEDAEPDDSEIAGTYEIVISTTQPIGPFVPLHDEADETLSL